jgi:hypothetical protein
MLGYRRLVVWILAVLAAASFSVLPYSLVPCGTLAVLVFGFVPDSLEVLVVVMLMASSSRPNFVSLGWRSYFVDCFIVPP